MLATDRVVRVVSRQFYASLVHAGYTREELSPAVSTSCTQSTGRSLPVLRRKRCQKPLADASRDRRDGGCAEVVHEEVENVADRDVDREEAKELLADDYVATIGAEDLHEDRERAPDDAELRAADCLGVV